MAAVRALNPSTDFFHPPEGQGLKSAGDIRQIIRRMVVKEKLPSGEDSSAESMASPESSDGGPKMRVIKAPASADKSFSGWSEVNQTWEGRVVENSPELREFVAVISDRTCRSNPDEEVVIGYESVIKSDIDLIAEGAVFFWNIGKYRKCSEGKGKVGPAVNKYELRFRRLPPISKETVEEIKQLSKGLYKIIHGH
ncbi:hypothetical protein [Pseudomonas sp. LF052]